jgi:hypothetical protein
VEVSLQRDVPGCEPLRLLLKSLLHYNSVCSILPHAALQVLGQEDTAGHALFDLWFANHAATSVERHVTVPLGERDKAELRSSAPVLALVFSDFAVYPQAVQVGIW